MNESLNNSYDPYDDEPSVTFAELGVPAPLLRVLAADGKTEAFPIQADTLPDSLNGRDILGRGRTGSGKTLAFCIPLAARLCPVTVTPDLPMPEYRKRLKHAYRRQLEERVDAGRDFTPHPRGLILAPTRELANQINEVLSPLARMAGMTTTVVYGGVRQNRQVRELKAGAEIVVACPGRLEDLLRQKLLTLSDVEIVVIDEADEMADMGFLPPVRRLLAQIRPDAQHMLFSATLDHGIDELVREFLRDPKTHSVDEPTAVDGAMTQHVFEVEKSEKPEIVRALASGKGRRILFTRTKFQAKKLAASLTRHGIPAAELHGNLSQNQRDRNLAAFESGEVNVMVATDVAARGIDVSNVELVVQVDPPEDPKSFVHRSGRTARAGNSGDVVTLVTPDVRRKARRMLREAGITVKPVKVRADSPEVLELVGERAEKVEGWTLPEPQNGGKGKNGGKGGKSGKSGKSGKFDKADKPFKKGGKTRRNRDRDDAVDATVNATADATAEPANAGDSAAFRHMPQDDDRALTPSRKRHRHDKRDRAAAAPDAGNERKSSWKAPHRRHRDDMRAAEGEKSGRRGRDDRAWREDDAPRGGKRIHRRDENRIVRDERSEMVKRHERRMNAKYGSGHGTDGEHGHGNPAGPRRHHGKAAKRAPFRMR
ncbi:DEAD/DEAH box helicase [Bifidobacterium avesanii]|uniref:DEAD/DEAH box helicase n=1 Tax=Bifidobacterium avesanii TaxID=1798157 RepID=UPI0019534E76|nr:DEAD/DEAH box helicase [Bifidobacterium avesanii]